jgi:hypothetical protein
VNRIDLRLAPYDLQRRRHQPSSGSLIRSYSLVGLTRTSQCPSHARRQHSVTSFTTRPRNRPHISPRSPARQRQIPCSSRGRSPGHPRLRPPIPQKSRVESLLLRQSPPIPAQPASVEIGRPAASLTLPPPDESPLDLDRLAAITAKHGWNSSGRQACCPRRQRSLPHHQRGETEHRPRHD